MFHSLSNIIFLCLRKHSYIFSSSYIVGVVGGGGETQG